MSKVLDILNEDKLLMQFIKMRGYDFAHMDQGTKMAYARSEAFKQFKRNHKRDTNPNDHSSVITAESKGFLMSYIQAKGLNPLSLDGNQKNIYSGTSEFRRFKHHHKIKMDKVVAKIEKAEAAEKAAKEAKKKKKLKEEYDQDCITFDIPLLIRVLECAREDIKSDAELHRMVERLLDIRDRGMLTMDDYDEIAQISESLVTELKKASDTDDDMTAVSTPAGVGGTVTSPISATDSVKAMESKKTAKMVKEIHTKLKEEMYDWEKDDKRLPAGKGDPIVKKADNTKSVAARAILSGGKTMTGKPRDTVALDPLLKTGKVKGTNKNQNGAGGAGDRVA